jgi:hypothetical protein
MIKVSKGKDNLRRSLMERYMFDCDCINIKVRDNVLNRTKNIYSRSDYMVFGVQVDDSMRKLLKALNEGKVSFEDSRSYAMDLRKEWNR